MKKWAGTLIGGGLGFAVFGPLGGIIGAYIGSMVTDDKKRVKGENNNKRNNFSGRRTNTRGGDFAVSMLALFAYVTKADNKVKSSEINYVKEYLIEKFGRDNAQDLMYLYKEILSQNYNIYDVAQQVKANMNYNTLLEMIHVLFGIAQSDGTLDKKEISAIKEIANGLGITRDDFNSIKSMFQKEQGKSGSKQYYDILGITPDANDKEVKKAFREKVSKYHPDKVENLGPEFKELAEEKFKEIHNAYEKIKNARGMK